MVKKVKKKKKLSVFNKPSNKDTRNYGVALQLCKSGRFSEALELCRAVAERRPGFADIHNLLGMILLQLAREGDALASLENAIALNPRKAEYFYNIGVLHQGANHIPQAIDAFCKTIKLQPKHRAALHNLGILYQKSGQYLKAGIILEKALSLDPASYLTLHELGNTYAELAEIDKAIAAFEGAITFNENFGDAYAALAALLYKHCFWDKHARIHKMLLEMMERQLNDGVKTSLTPYSSIVNIPDPAVNYAVAKSWAAPLDRESGRAMTAFSFAGRDKDRDKIHIGYLSNDFRKHPMMDCIGGMLAWHDRRKFNVTLYSYGRNDGSMERKNAERAADKFVECFGASDIEVARQIYADKIDILVDLAGHTEDNRFEIMALRPAPVQAHYLGLAGTTGADFIDYYIADEVVAPQSEARYYSECLAYLRDCYFSYSASSTCDEKFRRKDFGFSAGKFIFASFNNSYKITKKVFSCWMSILKCQDNAVLVVLVSGDTEHKNLQRAVEEHGVSLERVFFLSKASKEVHLARLRAVDLVLDTMIYTGHTTTAEALYVGTPVLTTRGRHLASRVSESMLYSVGLHELVVDGQDAYQEKAVSLAGSREALQQIKEKISRGRRTSSLLNVDIFTSNMEDLYQRMWQNFNDNKKEMIAWDE